MLPNSRSIGLLKMELVHRHVACIRRRVGKRSIAEVNAVAAVACEGRRQVGCVNGGKCNPIRRSEAAVACGAHVQGKADDVTNSPFAAVSTLVDLVPLLLPFAVNSPRPRVVACALTSRIVAHLETVRANTELRYAHNCDHLKFKVKATSVKPDVGNESVELVKIHQVV